MFKVMRRYMPPATAAAPPSPFAWGRTERLRELFGRAFDLRFEQGTSYYRERSAEAADVLDRLWPDACARRQSRSAAAAGAAPGLRGVPRRVRHRPWYLRAAHLLGHRRRARVTRAQRTSRR
jgi:hypothetical protein